MKLYAAGGAVHEVARRRGYIHVVVTLDDASLTAAERGTLERFVRLLREDFGPELHGVWLYGSRARGDPRHPESDIDVLVVAKRRGIQDDLRVRRLVEEAAEPAGVSPSFVSTKLYEPELVANRRAIRSFFMREVDRDKIVLAGKP